MKNNFLKCNYTEIAYRQNYNGIKHFNKIKFQSAYINNNKNTLKEYIKSVFIQIQILYIGISYTFKMYTYKGIQIIYEFSNNYIKLLSLITKQIE